MRVYPEGDRANMPAIYCDICAASCRKTHDNEAAELSATWGYDSGKDLTSHRIDLCESCFDKTIAFLRTIRTKNPADRAVTAFDALDGDTYAG